MLTGRKFDKTDSYDFGLLLMTNIVYTFDITLNSFAPKGLCLVLQLIQVIVDIFGGSTTKVSNQGENRFR
jgi:hypothetical protein